MFELRKCFLRRLAKNGQLWQKMAKSGNKWMFIFKGPKYFEKAKKSTTGI